MSLVAAASTVSKQVAGTRKKKGTSAELYRSLGKGNGGSGSDLPFPEPVDD